MIEKSESGHNPSNFKVLNHWNTDAGAFAFL